MQKKLSLPFILVTALHGPWITHAQEVAPDHVREPQTSSSQARPTKKSIASPLKNESKAEPAPPQASAAPTPEEPHASFEMSVASGYQFNTQDAFEYDDDIELLPTSAVMLCVDWFLSSRLRLSGIYNMSTSTEKRIVDGVITERMLPSLMMLGLSWTALTVPFGAQSRIEVRSTAYGGSVVGDLTRVFPAMSIRFHFLKDVKEGINLYFGALWAFRVHTTGPFYGVSYRF